MSYVITHSDDAGIVLSVEGPGGLTAPALFNTRDAALDFLNGLFQGAPAIVISEVDQTYRIIEAPAGLPDGLVVN